MPLGMASVHFQKRGLTKSSDQSNSASGALSLTSLGPELLRTLQHHETARLDVYFKALIAGWRTGFDRFVLDISRDALTVVDYLCARPDVLPEHIGAAGVSLGGMACWLLAAADTRIRCAMPAIGVQSFNHSLRNGLWGARVDSIRPAFEAAAADLKKASVDDDVVAAVWSRLAPGIAEARRELQPQKAACRTLSARLLYSKSMLTCLKSSMPAASLRDAFVRSSAYRVTASQRRPL